MSEVPRQAKIGAIFACLLSAGLGAVRPEYVGHLPSQPASLSFVADSYKAWISALNGLWVSNDRLASWQLAINADSVPIEYGLASQVLGWAYTYSKFLLTEDAGLHWRTIPVSVVSRQAAIEAAFVELSGRMWIGVNSEDPLMTTRKHSGPGAGTNPDLKLYSSTDKGRTWVENVWRSGDDHIEDVQFTGRGSGIVRTEYSVYWTSDRGGRWQRAIFNTPVRAIDGPSAFMSIRQNGAGVIGFQDGHLFRTTDGGRRWTLITSKALESDYLAKACFISDASGYGLSINENLFDTSDGGHHWHKVEGISHATALACRSDRTAFVASGTDLFRLK